MKNIVYILIFFLFPYLGLSQSHLDTLNFQPLTIIEKISDINEIKSLVRSDSLGKTDYFFTENFKNKNGLFFIKKENENWSVHDFELNYGSNTMIKEIKSESNRFISIQVYRFPSGACASTYGIIILFDLFENEWTDFSNFNRFECYDENAKVSSVSECKVDFTIQGNHLTMSSSKNLREGFTCFESGGYTYENRKFIKRMFLDEIEAIPNGK